MVRQLMALRECFGERGASKGYGRPCGGVCTCRRGSKRFLNALHKAYVDAPIWQAGGEIDRAMWVRHRRMFDLSIQPVWAAGLYGVRRSDPNRLGVLEGSAPCTGFSDLVSLTVCPYLVRRPARTLSGSSVIRRAQCCVPPHVSIATKHGAWLAKCSRYFAPVSFKFTISPVSISTQCS